MEILVKVGDKRDRLDPAYLSDWRDGQIVDVRPDGYYKPQHRYPSLIVIRTPYSLARTQLDAKRTIDRDLKRYITPRDRAGRLPWEALYDAAIGRSRKSDWFVDFKAMLNAGIITASQYSGLYDFTRKKPKISISNGLSAFIFHEDVNTRQVSYIKNMAVAAGTYTIGAAGTYANLLAFEADLAPTLTGNITAEVLDESVAENSTVTFSLDTATYKLLIAARYGAEHNGTFGGATHSVGDGARLVMGNYDKLYFNEATAGTLNDVEVRDLVFDIATTGAYALYALNGFDSTEMLLHRNIIKGDVSAINAIRVDSGAVNASIRNNIIYDFTNTGSSSGRAVGIADVAASIANVYNNTVVNCKEGVRRLGYLGTVNLKNNLVQACTTDYNDGGGGWNSSATNVSEDATSPDIAYRSKDLHTNSIFLDYMNRDLRLSPTGDATNLAIVDDATAPGGFTDDIQRLARSTWYAGAFEIVASGAKALLDIERGAIRGANRGVMRGI